MLLHALRRKVGSRKSLGVQEGGQPYSCNSCIGPLPTLPIPLSSAGVCPRLENCSVMCCPCGMGNRGALLGASPAPPRQEGAETAAQLTS